jgi:hypothetical protein
MLLGNKTDPGCQASPGRKHFPITDLGDQGGGDDRTDARDFLKPPALLTRSMLGVDALLDGFIRRRFGENPSLATSI